VLLGFRAIVGFGFFPTSVTEFVEVLNRTVQRDMACAQFVRGQITDASAALPRSTMEAIQNQTLGDFSRFEPSLRGKRY
jgi:hypothetical protein